MRRPGSSRPFAAGPAVVVVLATITVAIGHGFGRLSYPFPLPAIVDDLVGSYGRPVSDLVSRRGPAAARSVDGVASGPVPALLSAADVRALAAELGLRPTKALVDGRTLKAAPMASAS